MVYQRTERAVRARQEAQTRILRAAGRLFSAKGYDATTMQDIVEEAGTSIGNVYFYFKNKDALMRALVESSFTSLFDAAEERVARVPQGAGRLGALVAINATTMLTARRAMVRVLLADSRAGVIQRIGDIAVERWTRLLASALPDRRPDELPAIAAAIWGINRSVVERVARDVLPMDTKHAVGFIVRWTLRALDTEPDEIERIASSAWRLASHHALELGTDSW